MTSSQGQSSYRNPCDETNRNLTVEEKGNVDRDDSSLQSDLGRQLTSKPSLEASSQFHSVIDRLRCRKQGQLGPFTHPLGNEKTSADVIVCFNGSNDPYNPLNWAFRKKALTTLLYALTTFGSTWASAIFSPGSKQVVAEFQVSQEVGELGVSLFLFGSGLGPFLWAPLSDIYGRKPAIILPYFVAAIFAIATAVSKDVQTALITRFFCGFFSSAPVSNTGGIITDIWTAEHRGAPTVGFALAVMAGPTIGPFVAASISHSYLGWRWTDYITGIMMFFFLALDIIFIDESCATKLLEYKARRLRHESGNWALHARHEENEVSTSQIMNTYLVIPFKLLLTPICIAVALYAAFVYGLLYMNLSAYRVMFQEERGWNQVVGSLPFLAVFVGILMGAVAGLFNEIYYIKKFRQNNRQPVPEARLPPMMAGSLLFVAGLFIMGWTSPRKIFWFASIVGAACTGFGFFTIFQAALCYLIDTFPSTSASAVGGSTFLRNMIAGAFPFFTAFMYHGMGIAWAQSLLGFIAIALIPIPFLFYAFGAKIRAKSKMSRESHALP
ncbi:conserved hypothetical protein [Uncinocarpus reesii 1704]|uniref:Major facilitator superfamily (MFS) profile domain-containing protein n=1 Tax=Uncinocarpus reesii (strain UAMH 1704) TaxID=336963 RepID=C4JFA1_UNCRE|nr:uncharacterized protein UREG_02323 [Uncinocarpus reesii 1704]EEP77474.1 conserved hypothetical protein [Uncinocarpus reesii 1704]